MKKLFLFIILSLSFQITSAQDLDRKTLAKIKVKLITAENSFSEKQFIKTLQKIKEIENIVGKNTYEDIQNLKVMSLLMLKRFDEAKTELDALYEMDPSDGVLTSIASYSDKIDEGIQAEIQRKKDVIAADKRRKERIRLEKIEKEKEQIKLDKILHQFEFKTCSECRGVGYFNKNDKEICNNYNSYPGIGFWYCKGRGKIIDLGKTYYCKKCKGKGYNGGKYKETCDECDGKKKVLKYTGYPSISDYEESKYIKENRYTIERYIKEKKQKEYQRKKERERKIASKKEELKKTLKTRTLTDIIYFDDKRNETLSKYSAKFYRAPQKKVNGWYHIKDYSIKTNKLVLEAYSSQIASLTSAHLRGIVTWYYSSSTKGVSSSYDGRIQTKLFYDDNGYKKIIMNYNASNQNKIKMEFLNTTKSIFKTNNYGNIDFNSYQKYSNGFPKYIKWTYIGSKKKYNKYFIFNMDENGNLTSRFICNRKWKIKKTISY